MDMDRSDLNFLDVDLESGDTSEEDARKASSLRCEHSRNLLDGEDRGHMSDSSGSTDDRNCSCSYEGLLSSDENFRKEVAGMVIKTVDKDNRKKKHTSKIPPKPPRPPKGPSLNPSDIKMLKEISELNLQRKKMERIRTMRKIKKEKTSSPSSNIFALLVTLIFFLVIIFQGNVSVVGYLSF